MWEKFLTEKKLEGMNNIERHFAQVMCALYFIFTARFTTAKILQIATCRNTNGFANLLVQMKLLTKRKVLNYHIYGLTKLGADFVCGTKFDTLRVSPSHVEHTLSMQRETLAATRLLGVEDFEFEVSLMWLNEIYDFTDKLRSDSIWIRPTNEMLVEMELSAKNIKNGELDRFFQKILCHPTTIVFNDINIMIRYLRAASRYYKSGLPIWYKKDQKWVREEGNYHPEMIDWNRCHFKMLDDETTDFINLQTYLEPDVSKHFIKEKHFL